MAKKIKIGIIGSGGIAQAVHMPAFASMEDRCEMVAICDIDPQVGKKAASKFGVKDVYADHQDMLKSANLDAVLVATPNRAHMEPTVNALKAGKHVLCEKPLAMNGADARKMCAAASKSGKILQVGLQTRFTGPAQFLKSFIDDGDMGQVYYARVQALRNRGVPNWGVFIDKEKQGGGPLVDIGVHMLDLTLWLMGNPKPISASGRTWDALGKDPALYNDFGEYDRSKFTVEDMAVGFIRFDNGAAVTLESSFMANIDGNQFQSQLFGEKAGAVLNPYDGNEGLKIYTEKNRKLYEMRPSNVRKVASAYDAAAAAFLTSIERGEPSKIRGEDGMTLNSIFDALYKSAQTGKEEAVDMAMEAPQGGQKGR